MLCYVMLCVGQACKVRETTTLLLVTLPDIHRFKKYFHSRTQHKTFINVIINKTTPKICSYTT